MATGVPYIATRAEAVIGARMGLVIGMAEATMLTACMPGRRFSVVTFATAMGRCVSARLRDIKAVRQEKATSPCGRAG